MLLGLVYATSGEIEVLGRRMPRHAREVLPQIGALIEEPAAHPHLSGRANLTLLDAAGPRVAGGGFMGFKRVEGQARRTRRQGSTPGALPFMVAVFITITHLVPPPGQGSAFLSAVLQDGVLYRRPRWRSCCRCSCRSRW